LNTQSLAQLRPLDEAQQRDVQGACEVALTEVLDGLAGLVAVHDMPIGTRIYLMDGINHLRGHLTAQTNELQATASGRLN
jgi:hypothetical protein